MAHAGDDVDSPAKERAIVETIDGVVAEKFWDWNANGPGHGVPGIRFQKLARKKIAAVRSMVGLQFG